MSLIVDLDAVIPISFWYRRIENDDGQTVGVEILQDESDDADQFEGKFCAASWDVMSSAKEDATVINHVNEKGMLRYKIFVPIILSSVCRAWNLTHDDLPLPIDRRTFYGMHDKVVCEIFRRWSSATGQEEIPDLTEEAFQKMYRQFVRDVAAKVLSLEKDGAQGV